MSENVRDQLVKRFADLLEAERTSRDFYAEHVGKFDDPKLEQMVKGLMVAEERHMKLVAELIELATGVEKDVKATPVTCSAEHLPPQLVESLELLDSPFSLLLITDLKSYSKATFGLVACMAEHGKKVTYLSLNKPVKKLRKVLGRSGVDIKGIAFCDPETPDDNNICFDIINLTSVSIAIVGHLEEGAAVIIDSLSVLSVYHPKDTVQRFVHFVTGKAKDKGADVVFLGLGSEADLGQDATLASFFDDVVVV